VPVTGRTTACTPEPTIVGREVRPSWAASRPIGRQRLIAARARVAVGKLSRGRTYSNIDPAVEEYVCAALGLSPTPATQVIARDRHAEYLYACASVGPPSSSSPPRSAIWQGARWARPRSPSLPAEGQLGDAAQAQPDPLRAPHRLARVLRGLSRAGLEDVALWHERDISHSSVERVVLPTRPSSRSTCCARRPASWPPRHQRRACPGQPDGGSFGSSSASGAPALVARLEPRRGVPIVQRDAGVVVRAQAPCVRYWPRTTRTPLGRELDGPSTRSATSRTSRASPRALGIEADVGTPGEHHEPLAWSTGARSATSTRRGRAPRHGGLGPDLGVRRDHGRVRSPRRGGSSRR